MVTTSGSRHPTCITRTQYNKKQVRQHKPAWSCHKSIKDHPGLFKARWSTQFQQFSFQFNFERVNRLICSRTLHDEFDGGGVVLRVCYGCFLSFFRGRYCSCRFDCDPSPGSQKGWWLWLGTIPWWSAPPGFCVVCHMTVTLTPKDSWRNRNRQSII